MLILTTVCNNLYPTVAHHIAKAVGAPIVATYMSVKDLPV